MEPTTTTTFFPFFWCFCELICLFGHSYCTREVWNNPKRQFANIDNSQVLTEDEPLAFSSVGHEGGKDGKSMRSHECINSEAA